MLSAFFYYVCIVFNRKHYLKTLKLNAMNTYISESAKKGFGNYDDVENVEWS